MIWSIDCETPLIMSKEWHNQASIAHEWHSFSPKAQQVIDKVLIPTLSHCEILIVLGYQFTCLRHSYLLSVVVIVTYHSNIIMSVITSYATMHWSVDWNSLMQKLWLRLRPIYLHLGARCSTIDVHHSRGRGRVLLQTLLADLQPAEFLSMTGAWFEWLALGWTVT